MGGERAGGGQRHSAHGFVPVCGPPKKHFHVEVWSAALCGKSALGTFAAPGGARQPRLKMVSPLVSYLPSRTSHILPPSAHLPHLASHLPPSTSRISPQISHLSPLTYQLAPPTSHSLPPISHLSPLLQAPAHTPKYFEYCQKVPPDDHSGGGDGRPTRHPPCWNGVSGSHRGSKIDISPSTLCIL